MIDIHEKKMKQVRIALGLNKSEVARKANMQPGVVAWIENGRFIPYESQLNKIAEALEWTGDPNELLNNID